MFLSQKKRGAGLHRRTGQLAGDVKCTHDLWLGTYLTIPGQTDTHTYETCVHHLLPELAFGNLFAYRVHSTKYNADAHRGSRCRRQGRPPSPKLQTP